MNFDELNKVAEAMVAPAGAFSRPRILGHDQETLRVWN